MGGGSRSPRLHSRPQMCCVGYGHAWICFTVVDNKVGVLFDTVRYAIPTCNIRCEQPHDVGIAEKMGSCWCATDFTSWTFGQQGSISDGSVVFLVIVFVFCWSWPSVSLPPPASGASVDESFTTITAAGVVFTATNGTKWFGSHGHDVGSATHDHIMEILFHPGESAGAKVALISHEASSIQPLTGMYTDSIIVFVTCSAIPNTLWQSYSYCHCLWSGITFIIVMRNWQCIKEAIAICGNGNWSQVSVVLQQFLWIFVSVQGAYVCDGSGRWYGVAK